jgi:4-hydroxyproline epimerase
MASNSIHRIKVVDSHTAGEPTRVVISGGPDFRLWGHETVADLLHVFKEEWGHWRSAIVNEPRGSDVFVGALLVEPRDKSCVTGVIFFNNVGYLGMCGHGTIGVVETLAYLGRISPGVCRIETPVGVVTAKLNADSADMGRCVSVENVPSYRFKKDAPVEVPGTGLVRGDIAWSGNWFYLIEAHGQTIELKNVEALTAYTWEVRQALKANGIFGADGAEIDHIELFAPHVRKKGESRKLKINSKNFVLCPGKAYDRSPCGTGTSAKLACLAADGKLYEREEWVQESIIGSIFTASYKRGARKGEIIPTITGAAHVMSEGELILDYARDPFCWGIRTNAPLTTNR